MVKTHRTKRGHPAHLWAIVAVSSACLAVPDRDFSIAPDASLDATISDASHPDASHPDARVFADATVPDAGVQCNPDCDPGKECYEGVCRPPVSLSAGWHQICALWPSGRASCWGREITADPYYPQTRPVDVPMLDDAVELSSRSNFQCARRRSGQVSCWGREVPGIGGRVLGASTRPAPVSGVIDAISLASGGDHACVLESSGEIRCWGRNASGELGDGTLNDKISAVPVTVAPGPFDEVISGNQYSCGRVGGRVYCWGVLDHAEIADVTTARRMVAGDRFACIVLEDGSGRCWGAGRGSSYPVSGRIAGPIADVVASAGWGCIVRPDGTLACSGRWWDYDTSSFELELNPPTTVVQHLAIANNAGCFVDPTGATKCWGYGLYGMLGDGREVGRSTTTVPFAPTDIQQFACGATHVCTLDSAGEITCWGGNSYGQLGTRHTRVVRTATVVAGVSAEQVSAGRFFTCARHADGGVSCWGNNERRESSTTVESGTRIPTRVEGLDDTSFIVSGIHHSCAIRGANREVHCWGWSSIGQLGPQLPGDRGQARRVGTLEMVDAVAAGNISCAIVGGEVFCWGRNNIGQINGVPAEETLPPTRVPGISTAIAVTAGSAFACALLRDGTARCWGFNVDGQSGTGTTGDIEGINAVAGLTDAVQIESGSQHTCARHANGRVSCWGSDWIYGRLGQGPGAGNSNVPRLVVGIERAVDICAGQGFNCALLEDRTLRCWGDDTEGPVSGDPKIATTPVDVSWR